MKNGYIFEEVLTQHQIQAMNDISYLIIQKGDKDRHGLSYLGLKLIEEIGELMETIEYDDSEMGEEFIDVVMLLVQMNHLVGYKDGHIFDIPSQELKKLFNSKVPSTDMIMAIGHISELIVKTNFPARKTIESKYKVSLGERVKYLTNRLLTLFRIELRNDMNEELKRKIQLGAEYKLQRLITVHNLDYDLDRTLSGKW